ncbi:MAG: carbonic anhydrase [Clostridium sp.]|uniref:carbonic anhydrase n=1 Tax=Clostridium sp. TaxID=1506 RepID=UPI002FC8E5A0
MGNMISLDQLCGINTKSTGSDKCCDNISDDKLIKVLREEDIPSKYRGTPVDLLLRYHNLRETFDKYTNAKILVGMCMDNRKHLHIPDNFAYIIRSGGGNLRYSEFKVSYAVAVGGVEAIVLIGHNNCGMTNVVSKEDKFISGLVERCGWSEETAREHFRNYLPMFEIGNEVDFVVSEAKRLRDKYKGMLVAPLLYKVEDNLLYLVKED